MKILSIFLNVIFTSTLRKRKYNYDHQVIYSREIHGFDIKSSNDGNCSLLNNDYLENKYSLDVPLDLSFKNKYKLLKNRSSNYYLLKDKINPGCEDMNTTPKNYTTNHDLLNGPLDLRIKRPKIDKSSLKSIKTVTIKKKSNKQHLFTELNSSLKDTTISKSEIQEFEQKKATHFISSQIPEIYGKITKYIKKTATTTNFDHYITKIANIKLIYEFFYQPGHSNEDNNDMINLLDIKLIEILKAVLFKFKKNTQFTEKNHGKFISKLFFEIHSTNEFSNFKVELKKLNNKKIKYLFYAEYMKCVKYFAIVPELMTLGLIFSYRSIYDLIISIRLINLLLDKKNFEEDVKVFALFLVKNVFSCVNKNAVDFFTIQKFYANCLMKKHNLHFFLWEMNNERRKYIKRKFKNKKTNFLSGIDKIHLKSVLLVFLYQQMIFLEFYNISESDSERYFKLIDRVIKQNKCVSCDFNRYMKLLKSFN